MTHKPSSPGQREFESQTALNRRLILRQAQLPTVTVFEGQSRRKRIVKPYQLIAVIRAILDHGQGCWLRVATIAAETRLPRNVVLRVTAALLQTGLISVVKHPRAMGGFSHQYTVNWSELALLCGRKTDRSAVPTGDRARSPRETGAVPTGDSACPHGGPPRIEKREVSSLVRSNETRDETADELRYPNFSGIDFSSPWGVNDAIELLTGFGIDPDRIALAAAVAVRKGKKPHALFVKLLRDGWGKFQPADQDHETAKQTLATICQWDQELAETDA